MVCKRYTQYPWASLVAENVKNPPAMWETCVLSLGWEDIEGGPKGRSQEEGMAAHSSILAWRIPVDFFEEPDGLQSTGSQRTGHD